jgi:hypothetical protein
MCKYILLLYVMVQTYCAVAQYSLGVSVTGQLAKPEHSVAFLMLEPIKYRPSIGAEIFLSQRAAKRFVNTIGLGFSRVELDQAVPYFAGDPAVYSSRFVWNELCFHQRFKYELRKEKRTTPFVEFGASVHSIVFLQYLINNGYKEVSPLRWDAFGDKGRHIYFTYQLGTGLKWQIKEISMFLSFQIVRTLKPIALPSAIPRLNTYLANFHAFNAAIGASIPLKKSKSKVKL